MGKLVWTLEARSWLKEIHDYIARDNRPAARETVDGIRRKAASLTSFPEMGHRLASVPDRSIRVLLYGHYRIAYEVVGAEVRILGVFHGALNIERFLS